MYYMNRVLNPIEIIYALIEKLSSLESMWFRIMLNRPIIIGRIGKWSLALLEFTLIYFPEKSVKG